jgi:hypothetical protein
MRRVIMHEQLPPEERFNLGSDELKLLHRALSKIRPNSRGIHVVKGIKEAFQDRPIEFYHKAGYANRWFSDNVYVHAKDTNERWIVDLANRPGRHCLDEAALTVGKILSSGLLKKEESVFQRSLSQVAAHGRK